jgi:ferrous iron transport protein B
MQKPLIAESPPITKNEFLPLESIPSNQKVSVRHLDGGKGFLARMASMGFTYGTEVKVLRNDGHNPLLVLSRGTRVALGKEEAKKIFVSPSLIAEEEEKVTPPPTQILIALAGQPNVGKSTVFNQLTGLNQHVGNWSGKTIEKKMGKFVFKNREFTLVDLPGTYSLTANSEEERIARDFILQEHPDLVVVVVDAAHLERNLYLVAELLLLPSPLIIVLNMMDVAKQEGIQIDIKILETTLGIPVIPMVASHGTGTPEFLESIDLKLQKVDHLHPQKPSILPSHESILDEMKNLIAGFIPMNYPLDWVGLKMLEGDEELLEKMKTLTPLPIWEKIDQLLYQHEDAILDIAGARYEWIARVLRSAVTEPKASRLGLTTRLDRYLTHPIAGTLILAGILGGVFWLTYSIGTPIQGWLAHLVLLLAGAVRTQFASFPPWLVEIFAGGILGGLGMVLTFLPILVIFYAILGLMEDTGYLTRAAYITDRWMHMMGLHGKSFLPILLGFGCNVPAVLGTRIIESKRARLLTILLVPLVPCTARMAVITILVPIFFGSSAIWIAWILVAGNLILLALLGLLLHGVFFGNEHIAFIMELPLYHLPNIKTIGMYVWQNIIGFLQKAGTTILIASMIIWGLSYFPHGAINTSYLAWFGNHIKIAGSLMGLPWPVFVAILTSFAAKENTIATLGILYGNINTVLPTLLTFPAALSLLVFQMLFIPCVGTVTSIFKETHSLKWTLLSLGLMLIMSFGLSILIFQVGKLF